MNQALRVDVRGVDTAYRRAGSGPPLLYLHGNGLTREWLALYETLARDFTVLVPNHPGYGDTARPRWYRDVDDVSLHYVDFLDTFGVDVVDLVGHSQGAIFAASLAAMRPERLRSLTLIAPAALPTVAPARRPPILPPGAVMDDLLFNGQRARFPQYLEADDLGGRIEADADDPFADPAAYSWLGPPSLYRRLARITCPRQILVPDDDRIVAPERFAEWAHWLDAPLVQIRGRSHPTGHLLIVQEPEAIAAAIRAVRE